MRALHKIWTKNENDSDNAKHAENASGSSSEAIDTPGYCANSFSSRALIERIKSEANDDDRRDINSLEKPESSKSSCGSTSPSSQQSPNFQRESINSTAVVPIPAPRKISCQLNRFMSGCSLQMLQIL